MPDNISNFMPLGTCSSASVASYLSLMESFETNMCKEIGSIQKNKQHKPFGKFHSLVRKARTSATRKVLNTSCGVITHFNFNFYRILLHLTTSRNMNLVTILALVVLEVIPIACAHITAIARSIVHVHRIVPFARKDVHVMPRVPSFLVQNHVVPRDALALSRIVNVIQTYVIHVEWRNIHSLQLKLKEIFERREICMVCGLFRISLRVVILTCGKNRCWIRFVILSHNLLSSPRISLLE